ncbi:MAG: hypothetical protein M3N82_04530 [Pseudomonadota bacterium]|nr:hypothetical protein [Pseudomonadota bacterium]
MLMQVGDALDMDALAELVSLLRQQKLSAMDCFRTLLPQLRGHLRQGDYERVEYLTGCKAESAETFRTAFEQETGCAFSPESFRAHRLKQLDQADVFVNIRAGMSESSAFELSYHIFRGACTPILFLIWKQAPIKTTLLKDLGSLCDVTYLEFDDPAELDEPLAAFFRSCERARRSARPALARAGA